VKLALDADGQAIADAVRDRMSTMNLPISQLARSTGLSETTIRAVLKGNSGGMRGATLDAVSAGLGWPRGYLRGLASGKPHMLYGLTVPELLGGLGRKLDRLERKLDELLAGPARSEVETEDGNHDVLGTSRDDSPRP
jgi:Cro/C1-type HTH DNA-binding domain